MRRRRNPGAAFLEALVVALSGFAPEEVWRFAACAALIVLPPRSPVESLLLHRLRHFAQTVVESRVAKAIMSAQRRFDAELERHRRQGDDVELEERIYRSVGEDLSLALDRNTNAGLADIVARLVGFVAELLRERPESVVGRCSQQLFTPRQHDRIVRGMRAAFLAASIPIAKHPRLLRALERNVEKANGMPLAAIYFHLRLRQGARKQDAVSALEFGIQCASTALSMEDLRGSEEYETGHPDDWPRVPGLHAKNVYNLDETRDRDA